MRRVTKIGLFASALMLTLTGAATATAQPDTATTRAAAGDAAYFEVANDHDYRNTWVIKLTKPEEIQHARDLASGATTERPHVIGRIDKRPAPYNPAGATTSARTPSVSSTTPSRSATRTPRTSRSTWTRRAGRSSRAWSGAPGPRTSRRKSPRPDLALPPRAAAPVCLVGPGTFDDSLTVTPYLFQATVTKWTGISPPTGIVGARPRRQPCRRASTRTPSESGGRLVQGKWPTGLDAFLNPGLFMNAGLIPASALPPRPVPAGRSWDSATAWSRRPVGRWCRPVQ